MIVRCLRVTVGEIGLVAGHDVVVAGVVAVVVVAVAAEDGVLVGELGNLRQVLADLDAGHAGGDRLVWPADFLGGVGLQVEHVDVRRPAFEEQENARLCLGRRRRRRPRLQVQ